MARAKDVTVTVSREAAEAIREGIASGDYNSPEDVVSDALSLWRQRRQDDAGRLDDIRARIRRSLADPAPNIESEQVDAELDRLLEQASRA